MRLFAFVYLRWLSLEEWVVWLAGQVVLHDGGVDGLLISLSLFFIFSIVVIDVDYC